MYRFSKYTYLWQGEGKHTYSKALCRTLHVAGIRSGPYYIWTCLYYAYIRAIGEVFKHSWPNLAERANK